MTTQEKESQLRAKEQKRLVENHERDREEFYQSLVAASDEPAIDGEEAFKEMDDELLADKLISHV